MAKESKKTGFTTIDDVAERAKVSRITVSRVFSGKWEGKIRPQTVEKVLEAARALQYTPNNLARSLSSQKSNIVAVVINAHPGYFYSEVLSSMVAAIQAAGWQPLVFTVTITDDLDRIVAQVLQHRVDAIVVTSAALSKRIVKFFGKTPPIPVVIFKRVPSNRAFSGVWCDEPGGARKMADYLYETGHRRIGVLCFPTGETGRAQAFVQRLDELGVRPVDVLESNYTHEAGYEAADRLLSSGGKVDAIFCDEDTMALGAMDALRRKWGLRVPEDISVVGFDNSSIAALAAYDLTTMGHPLDEMIEATIRALHFQGEDAGAPVRQEFEMQLVVRGSSAARGQAAAAERES